MTEHDGNSWVHREVRERPRCPPRIQEDRDAAILIDAWAPGRETVRFTVKVCGTHLQGDAGFEELLEFRGDDVHQVVRSAPDRAACVWWFTQ